MFPAQPVVPVVVQPLPPEYEVPPVHAPAELMVTVPTGTLDVRLAEKFGVVWLKVSAVVVTWKLTRSGWLPTSLNTAPSHNTWPVEIALKSPNVIVLVSVQHDDHPLKAAAGLDKESMIIGAVHAAAPATTLALIISRRLRPRRAPPGRSAVIRPPPVPRHACRGRHTRVRRIGRSHQQLTPPNGDRRTGRGSTHPIQLT